MCALPEHGIFPAVFAGTALCSALPEMEEWVRESHSQKAGGWDISIGRCVLEASFQIELCRALLSFVGPYDQQLPGILTGLQKIGWIHTHSLLGQDLAFLIALWKCFGIKKHHLALLHSSFILWRKSILSFMLLLFNRCVQDATTPTSCTNPCCLPEQLIKVNNRPQANLQAFQE